jgi:flagellar basal-body rod protein FlgC
MSTLHTFEISAAGLGMEMLRLQTAARNLANANATFAPGTEAFQPMEVLASSLQVTTSGSVADRLYGPGLTAVVEPRASEPRMQYDPSHPHANAEGFVAHANVDVVSEMTAILRASRAYEANIKAINAAKAMAQQALEIGSST